MDTEKKEPALGKPWTVVKIFDTFTEADTLRTSLLEEWTSTGVEDMSVKVKLKSKGFTVRTRSTTEVKLSKKTKKKGNKNGQDSKTNKKDSD